MKKYVFALLLFIPLLFSSSVYADTAQDVVYNLNSTTRDVVLCNDNNADLPNCSDYRYIIIETNDTFAANQSFSLTFNFANKNVWPVSQTIDMNNFSTHPNQSYFAASVLDGTSKTITVTLTNSLNCPEPEPCPSCPDCSDASRYVQIVIDAFWKFVMAFAGVVTSILVIMLVFRLIRKAF